MNWYSITIPDNTNENLETSFYIGADFIRMKMLRIYSPLFNDGKWRCWISLNNDDWIQVSLVGLSLVEYGYIGFITDRRIKFPNARELNIAFKMYIGLRSDLENV